MRPSLVSEGNLLQERLLLVRTCCSNDTSYSALGCSERHLGVVKHLQSLSYRQCGRARLASNEARSSNNCGALCIAADTEVKSCNVLSLFKSQKTKLPLPYETCELRLDPSREDLMGDVDLNVWILRKNFLCLCACRPRFLLGTRFPKPPLSKPQNPVTRKQGQELG